MALIARQAEVAVETVYRTAPGGKAGLLEAAIQAALAGGAERSEIHPDERPAVRDVIDASDPREAIHRFAATLPATWTRIGPLLGVLDAASAEPELQQLRVDLERQRLEGMRRFARQLDRSGALRDGVTPESAADILWAVCGRANHDALVGVRGWSRGDYVEWVARILIGDLLEPDRAHPVDDRDPFSTGSTGSTGV